MIRRAVATAGHVMRRTVQPRPVPFYVVAVGVATVLLSPLLSILASVQIAENNAERIVAEQKRTEAAATAEARRVACVFFALNLDAFDETPPTSATGRNLRQTYLDFYRLSGCQPPRK
jgi:hypothetical protein